MQFKIFSAKWLRLFIWLAVCLLGSTTLSHVTSYVGFEVFPQRIVSHSESQYSTYWIGGRRTVSVISDLLNPDTSLLLNADENIVRQFNEAARGGVFVISIGAGFPLSCFEGYVIVDTLSTKVLYDKNVVYNKNIDNGLGPKRLFPTGFNLVNFVGNALFWLVSIYSFRYVAQSFIHVVRKKRKLCVYCGYPLSESICPECGRCR